MRRRVAVVVTAANEDQASAFRQELGERDLGEGWLWMSVSDPAGARIGSGGGTLNALTAVDRELPKGWVEETLVVIIHSGGDSRRSPSQSVCGKAWSKLPRVVDGKLSAPFDLLLEQLLALCGDSPVGCVVACSDVLLVLPEIGTLAGPGATGLAIRAPLEYGPEHGVYAIRDGEVRSFLQKASVPALRAAGAVEDDERVLLDSGVVFFDSKTTATMTSLGRSSLRDATSLGNGSLRVELYSDVLRAFRGGGFESFEEYEAMPADDPEPHRFRRVLWDALHETTLRAHVPAGADFRHLGTTREYVELMREPAMRRVLGLRRRAKCEVDPDLGEGVVLNSIVRGTHLGVDSVVEHSELESGSVIGPRSLCSCVRGEVRLGADLMIQMLPLLDGRFVCVLFGMDDDMKSAATFLNEPTLVASLWTAKLFKPRDTPEAALEAAMRLQHHHHHLEEEEEEEEEGSLSMAEVVRLADKRADFAWRRALERRAVADWAKVVVTQEDESAAVSALLEIAEEPTLLVVSVAGSVLARDRIPPQDSGVWVYVGGCDPSDSDVRRLGAAAVGAPIARLEDTGLARFDLAVLAKINKGSFAEILRDAVVVPSDRGRREIPFFDDLYAASPAAIYEGKVVEMCVLEGCEVAGSAAYCDLVDSEIGAGAVAYGLSGGGVIVPPRSHAQRLFLEGGASVVLVKKASDRLDEALFFGKPLADLFDPEALWPEREQRCLATARLFVIRDDDDGSTTTMMMPSASAAWRAARRTSILEALRCVDTAAMRAWREEVVASAVCASIGSGGNILAEVSPRHKDRVAAALEGLASTGDLVVAARALSQVAFIFHAPPGGGQGQGQGQGEGQGQGQGGREFFLLDRDDDDDDDVREMTGALADARRARGGSAVRHYYEAAARALVRRAVALSFPRRYRRPPHNNNNHHHHNHNRGVRATAPARVDLGGGWTDTPPITYELGGAVVNLAVRLDGDRPIGCDAIRRDRDIVLASGDEKCVVRSASDLDDRRNPRAKCALLKCCVAVRLLAEDQKSLRPVAAFELRSWSRLPKGSGLGTSSILAACALAALDAHLGCRLDRASLVEDVLLVEQELTTAGGWQDNVGGVYPGAKYATSSRGLPFGLEVCPIVPKLTTSLNRHLLLVYTGTSRLAKGLLDSVLRRWHARIPDVVDACDALLVTAEKAKLAIENDDLEALGNTLDAYWRLKKIVAMEDVEPPLVAAIIRQLKDCVFGAALCGAGGGGFLALLTKNPDQRDAVANALSRYDDHLTVHVATLDTDGLQLEPIATTNGGGGLH
ncbi:hypothetical protein CTAYLR_010231 [Chrysophaeum taylorii]|uniref:Fucokinase n=1 Tax=Chrysophaeum taylorii TaxID=2483200 RepID=A0AAD7U5X8_9STRA|nr:hypothetical protein CTAYLR_010231 [Chrysophaeum taylorii]